MKFLYFLLCCLSSKDFLRSLSDLNAVQLFERLLEIPIMWSKGRASGEVFPRLKVHLLLYSI